MEANCFLSLGSNLGNRVENLIAAVEALASDPRCRLLAAADLFETAPVGGPVQQGLYFNTVVALRTAMPPLDLLNFGLGIEQRLGRRRTVANGPRVIDIDLLLYDDLVCDSPALVLPHPRMHLRRFVLEPLMQVDAERIHPTLKQTSAQLLAAMVPGEFRRQRCVRVDHSAWTGRVRSLFVCRGDSAA
ncbi:MAG: 2-amino-4-hydroxy-6-hydroxymethyldihydropteridine diphosphokinase [Phycisphaerae bacterium]